MDVKYERAISRDEVFESSMQLYLALAAVYASRGLGDHNPEEEATLEQAEANFFRIMSVWRVQEHDRKMREANN